MSFAFRPPTRLKSQRKLLAAALLIPLAFLLLAGLFFLGSRARTDRSEKQAAVRSSVSSSVRINLPPPDLYRPITPEEALAENAKREFSGRPDSAAAAFQLKADTKTRERALECLTQAVYYEAASEGADGQRAVAQVVLNRMRHPGYPSSVCGVVYQGSERTTGCQFTFTCDGSLARIPIQSLWQQSRRVAAAALAGKVFEPVGHATHYHADYVLPYWADSLDKSAKIGRHIFYRFKSGLGSASAFRQRYAGIEPTPPAPSTVEVSLEAVQEAGPATNSPIESNPLQVDAGELIKGGEPKPELVADISQGKLLIDGDAPVTKTARRMETANCPVDAAGKPLRPLSANDARADGASGKCR